MAREFHFAGLSIGRPTVVRLRAQKDVLTAANGVVDLAGRSSALKNRQAGLRLDYAVVKRSAPL